MIHTRSACARVRRRQELTNERWKPSFGSAFNRNCRINRFTVGEQVFELPERYIFERDLGKGAYGLFPTHPCASQPLILLVCIGQLPGALAAVYRCLPWVSRLSRR